jgi:hypothetical protein
MTQGMSVHPEMVYFGIIMGMLIIAIPVSAAFVFQDVVIDPSMMPLQPGQKVETTAQLVIIPQGGSTTFIESNQLQLSTQLAGAQWEVQVMVNGIPAAKIPQNGDIVFINGFLLSYPTSSDVVVFINQSGVVPVTGGQEIFLVQAVQLNNAGQTIPGSTNVISEPVATPVTTPAIISTPSMTTKELTITTTRSPGLTWFAGFFGVAFCAAILRKIRLQQKRD